ADWQFRAAGAFFQYVRRQNSRLAKGKTRRLRRRYGLGARARARRGDQAVRRPARTRRAGVALLYVEPGGAHDYDLAALRALIFRGTPIATALRAATPIINRCG